MATRTSNNTILNKAIDYIHNYIDKNMEDYEVESITANIDEKITSTLFDVHAVRAKVAFEGDDEPWQFLIAVPFDGRKRVYPLYIG